MERYQHCELRMDGIGTYLERNIPLQLLIRTILFDKKAPPLGGAFFLPEFGSQQRNRHGIFTATSRKWHHPVMFTRYLAVAERRTQQWLFKCLCPAVWQGFFLPAIWVPSTPVKGLLNLSEGPPVRGNIGGRIRIGG